MGPLGYSTIGLGIAALVLFGLWKNEQSEHRADLIKLQAAITRADQAEKVNEQNVKTLEDLRKDKANFITQQKEWNIERAKLLRDKNDELLAMEQTKEKWHSIIENNDAFASRVFRYDLNSMFGRFHRNTCRTDCENTARTSDN